jgi:hypothetical protein
MKSKLMTLLVLGTLATVVQAQQSDKPFVIKASALSAFADAKDYLGGKTFGWGFEGGYDYAMPDNFSTITPWVGYVRFIGDPRGDFAITNADGTTAVGPIFDLAAWRVGVDLKWDTPFKGLRGWMGINLNYFDGNQRGTGKNYMTGTGTINTSPLPQMNAKWGARLGLDYMITKEFSTHFQYDFGYWMSTTKQPASPTNASFPRVKALNPMNPSWFSLSVGYHF